MTCEIKTFPDNVLREKAVPVEEITDDIRALAKDMVETMHKAPGVGLAAPQVGKGVRVIVVDPSAGEDPDELMILVNPEIVESSGEALAEEGCLSIPGEYAAVSRPANVTVTALDIDGVALRIEAEEMLARILQHEIDHLDGILFIDRLPSFKRDTLKKKIKKRIAAGEYTVTTT